MSRDDLNSRQRAFATIYAEGKTSIEQAAVQAGYAPKTAHAQGSRLLNNATVQRIIREIQDAAAKAVTVTVEKIMQGLYDLATGEPQRTITETKLITHDPKTGAELAVPRSVEVKTVTGVPASVRRAAWNDLAARIWPATSKHEHTLVGGIEYEFEDAEPDGEHVGPHIIPRDGGNGQAGGNGKVA